ncbi:MAG: DUF2577 family protein [Oscillospiraceae bacterium]
MDNPYITLVSMINSPENKNNQCLFLIGYVSSTSPLNVETNGIKITKNDLMINENCLKVNDKVILLTADKQEYFLICKVV